MPTSRNNREAIESRLAAAEEAVEKYGKDYTKGMQIPFRYLHPVTLQWMIHVICQGRADSQIAALEQVKADLKQVNWQVQVSQEEYDEIMAIKPLFLINDYQ